MFSLAEKYLRFSMSNIMPVSGTRVYSEIWHKGSLKNRQNKGLNDKW